MQTLRPYQSRTCDSILPAAMRRAANRRVLLCAPCGAGKTTIISELCLRSVAKGNKVVVVAHRRKLIQQIAERLKGHGVPYTVFMADLPTESAPWAVVESSAPVVVMSRDSGLASAPADLPYHPGLMIVDEAHLFAGGGYQRLVEQVFPSCIIGFTATPCRPDGTGMGGFFDELAVCTTIEELIGLRFLVPTEVYAPAGEGKKRRAGLAFGIAGDPVAQWFKHAEGLRTFAFTNKIADAKAVRDMYTAAGVPAVYADAKTPEDEREAMLADLGAGRVKVFCCTSALMGVGVDVPELDCVQCLVKNISPVAYWQTVGRGQRPAPGKRRAVLLDHGAAVYEHGMPNASPSWSLDPDDSVQFRTHKKHDAEPAKSKPTQCRACGCVFAGGGKCPNCGNSMARADDGGSPADVRENLSQFGDEFGGPPLAMQRGWRDILYMAARKGMRCSAASAMFQKKYGVWPDAAGVTPRATVLDRNRFVADAFPQYAGKVRA